MNKTASGIILILLFAGLLSLTSNVQPVKAELEYIYIGADGTVYPSWVPISNSNNVTYTFTGNIINASIIVERSNITINGAGHMIQGQRSGVGFSWSYINNVTVENTTIRNFECGVESYSSSYSKILQNNITANTVTGITIGSCNYTTIFGNYIVNNGNGITFSASSSYDIISENNIRNNLVDGVCLSSSSDYNIISANNIDANKRFGINLFRCSYNTISGNNITSNTEDYILFPESPNNHIYHNDIINNGVAYITPSSANVWDDGYPSGGNYWSGYKGADMNQDGIGDTPYNIDAPYSKDSNNTDRYPLKGPFNSFNIGTWNGVAHSVDTISNSTIISAPIFNGTAKTLTFNATGTSGTIGFCRIVIPMSLMSCTNPEDWIVTVNGMSPLYLNLTTDSNCTYMYFRYYHSTETVQIRSTSAAPEFQPFMLLPLLTIVTLIGITIRKRKRIVKK